jgi:hypothetical protein
VEVKALACELPKELGVPFSRFSCADIAEQAVQRGIVASISGATVWRWLTADAIRPWSHRTWIFPRDVRFKAKAERVLDLYHGAWEGQALHTDDYVLCADEKTSIQARKRCHATQAPAPGRPQRVEFEYERQGALAYMAAWDVQRARVFGYCEKTTGTDAFHHLVDLVMLQEPYRCAHRVFWITDNGSSHRGQASITRLAQWYPNAVQVHTPVHASSLNQVEIYFSIVQRKLLTPPHFPDLQTLERQLLEFQSLYERRAKPFEWKFSRDDLNRLLRHLTDQQTQQDNIAA